MLSFFPAPGAARGEGENAQADFGADCLIIALNSCGCVVCASSHYVCFFSCLN